VGGGGGMILEETEENHAQSQSWGLEPGLFGGISRCELFTLQIKGPE